MSFRPRCEPWTADDFRPIAEILLRRQGLNLSRHRLDLLQARLQARLRAQGVPSFAYFYDHVLMRQAAGPGMQLLIDLTTVNHTAFYREPRVLGQVADFLVERARTGLARAWSAGCSGGQEPYSLATCVLERFPTLVPNRLEIWASDISMGMLEKAARAIYAEKSLEDVSPDRSRRFFLRGRGHRHGAYRVAPEVRTLVRFVHFDLRSADWPIGDEFDAILCRNVAIYFEEPERLTLLERLTARLRAGGLLGIGNCEIFPELPGLLEKVGPSLYRKVASS